MKTKIEKLFGAYIKELCRFTSSQKVAVRKTQGEISEHFSFLMWALKRIILPESILYVSLGIIFDNSRVFDSLFLGLLIFTYSNFLPDFDALFKRGKPKDSPWYKKYAFLCFAPVYILSLISEEAKPIYTNRTKPFHNLKSMTIYVAFLVLLGSIFYSHPLEIVSLPIFGTTGYLMHLGVDNLKL